MKPAISRRLAALAAGVAAATVSTLVLAASPASADPVVSGNLTWGFKASFRSYLLSPPAGSVTAGAPATAASNITSYPVVSLTDGATTVVTFSGSTTYAKPAHGIDVTIANLTLTYGSDGTGQLTADLTTPAGTQTGVALADIAKASEAGGTITFTALATETGGTAFNYPAGTALDDIVVTLTVTDPQPSGTVPTSPEPGSSPAPTTTAPGLPVTGASVTGIIAAGVGLVAVGGLMLVVLRRRRA